MLPVDLMVELLMENASPAKCGGGQIMLGGELYDSLREDDLRGYIRDYLQSLVPPPKLLSECEEHVGVPVNDAIMIYRVGKHAYRSEDDRWYGYADMCQVIQPVEVNREL